MTRRILPSVMSRSGLKMFILILHCFVFGDARTVNIGPEFSIDPKLIARSSGASRNHFISPKAFQQKAISTYFTVDKHARGKFRTIQSAIDYVPAWNPKWTYIQINAGIYYEKVTIAYNKPNIILQGAGMDKTFIMFGDTATTAYGTANSATFTVWASNFTARGLSFKNSALPPPPGAINRQAVAVLLAGDMASFFYCGFYGAQDTLFDYQGRHYFKKCYIEGSIDFIFGHGQSIYSGCDLHVIAQSIGSITAQNRQDPKDPSGFIFIDCAIFGTGPVYLGRAWGPYSRVIFIRTYFGNIIVPEGWEDWNVPARQRTVYYAQHKCSGPGANLSGRVNWSHELSDPEAQAFQHISFINGRLWLDEI